MSVRPNYESRLEQELNTETENSNSYRLFRIQYIRLIEKISTTLHTGETASCARQPEAPRALCARLRPPAASPRTKTGTAQPSPPAAVETERPRSPAARAVRPRAVRPRVRRPCPAAAALSPVSFFAIRREFWDLANSRKCQEC